MQTYKADHFAFQVRDLDAAIAFYTGKLGLKLMSREVDPEHGEAFAFIELEGGNLELLEKLGSAEMQPQPVAEPYCPHLALGTDDLDAIVRLLQERHIPIVKGPLEIAGSVRWLYIADPDNNVIEFVQWL